MAFTSHTALVVTLFLTVACSPADRPESAPAEEIAQTAGGNGAKATPCTPLETRDANAPHQKPAFAGQTRACGVTTSTAFDVVVVAKGLESPWAVEPLPGGDLLVTEKPGRMRIVTAAGQVGEPIAASRSFTVTPSAAATSCTVRSSLQQ